MHADVNNLQIDEQIAGLEAYPHIRLRTFPEHVATEYGIYSYSFGDKYPVPCTMT